MGHLIVVAYFMSMTYGSPSPLRKNQYGGNNECDERC